MTLDATELDAITQEARHCFLYEDAPEYLLLLEQWAEEVISNPERHYTAEDYNRLMRAAHSLKGGAGIAQLSELQVLSHRLEDVLEALKEGRLGDRPRAHHLLVQGIEQAQELLAAAKQNHSLTPTPPYQALLAALTELLSTVSALPSPPTAAPPDLRTALTQTLEESLQILEASATDAERETALAHLIATAHTLGKQYALPWLQQLAAELPKLAADLPLGELVPAIVAECRQLQQAELVKLLPPEPTPTPPAETTPPQDSYLRIPVSRLDRLGNTVSELLIGQERFTLYQQQFLRANRELKHRLEQFRPIRDQVQTVYDRLATPLGGRGRPTNGHNDFDDVDDVDDFDALQFDHYTELHTALQDFQELLVRIQETGADIDLLNRDLQEALDLNRQHLNSLYAELTNSRLVPFRQLAEKFVTAVQALGDRHHKPVQLVIEGGDTLVDQVILQQLKAPLTHLVRNAFDHGLEPPAQRQQLGKSPTGTIWLRARLRGNAVEIQVADDGRGIDLQRVSQKAMELQLCSAEKVPHLSREQILEFLFVPGFSTAKEVSDLSGRGVGLDVVREQVQRSRGRLQITTEPQQGTTFTLTLPLTLSLLPMVLCQVGELTLAIPDLSIREVIALKEYTDIRHPSPTIDWQGQSIPLCPLHQLLPYHRPLSAPTQPLGVGVVVDVAGQAVALAVNYLIAERELVVKPFDQTVPVPPYVMGCTVLGSGEVVPVLAPDNFTVLLRPMAVPASPIMARPQQRTIPQVLIVDDSITVRRLLDRVLRQAGYDVVQCRDGKEALDFLLGQGDQVSLVITDIEMPRLDGYGLLEAIRLSTPLHHLPVAMLTSRGGDTHRQKAFQLGANDYITKPFQPQGLLQKVTQLLAGRQAAAVTPSG
ncbi:chemotaxis signal transduction system histidine kinase CheA [Thermosynechococcus sp. NK55a]|uniref:hybrid sensor histidine kinase/response regulator n=2 Tax=unclassified Thermosynechococcus TaxID=2622553 RepID=UPI0003D8F62C|nr:hybrid sensor histidine kinase/response regulator [Thermosynechococcus sp. NK55a]AHB87423.1 chemotaxis signal transduction system histidine kinase CheA [Thermosynechococcus sp. NK55a]